MPVLHNGARFPALTFSTVGGGELKLPSDLTGDYGVVLFYRGTWCPFCNAQLAAFSRAGERLTELGIKVVAISVDDEATSAALVEKHKLNFPIGYGAGAEQVAAAIGAYTNAEPRYLQSTGFVLDPEGRVVVAVYSSGAIGRLMPDDVLGLVKYLRSKP
jgi:peroxiredoxin